jgi:hypothetical protein
MVSGANGVGEVRVMPDPLHAFTMAICGPMAARPRKPGWWPITWCWPTSSA